MVDQPVTEAEWQAQADANTLAEAEVIKGDEARLKKAQEAAKKIADEQRERAAAMSKVARQNKPANKVSKSSDVALQHLITKL